MQIWAAPVLGPRKFERAQTIYPDTTIYNQSIAFKAWYFCKAQIYPCPPAKILDRVGFCHIVNRCGTVEAARNLSRPG